MHRLSKQVLFCNVPYKHPLHFLRLPTRAAPGYRMAHSYQRYGTRRTPHRDTAWHTATSVMGRVKKGPQGKSLTPGAEGEQLLYADPYQDARLFEERHTGPLLAQNPSHPCSQVLSEIEHQ